MWNIFLCRDYMMDWTEYIKKVTKEGELQKKKRENKEMDKEKDRTN